MENFTTQEHERDLSRDVVDNPGKTIANMREQHKTHNLINGMVISALALTVVFTGTMLGATTAHNQDLKAKISNLEAQNKQTTMMQSVDTATPDTQNRTDNQRTADTTVDDNPTTTAPTTTTTPRTTVRRTWERRTRTTPQNDLVTYTTRQYLNQFFNNPENKRDQYVSQEKHQPVNLPKLTSQISTMALQQGHEHHDHHRHGHHKHFDFL